MSHPSYTGTPYRSITHQPTNFYLLSVPDHQLLNTSAMDLLCRSASWFPIARPHPNFRPPLHRSCFNVRLSASLPILEKNAKHYRELTAAIDVVERACRLCVDVKKSLFHRDGRVLEKNDQTPVTIADFGVQALVSLEMKKLFPSIPLVAEEDSAILRSNNLVGAVVDVVTDKSTCGDRLTQDNILRAIDRGGKDAYGFGPKPATYWVLDPIDGTRGFVKGSEALYVIGLALVVDGKIVLGVMGCPNWQENYSNSDTMEAKGNKDGSTLRKGILMVSHIRCGTWKKTLWDSSNMSGGLSVNWFRCLVDDCQIVQKARYCIQDSQTWDSLPLSSKFDATTNAENVGNNQILLVPTCCGSLSKYLMLASGRGSVYILRAKIRLIKSWDHAAGIICVHEAGGKDKESGQVIGSTKAANGLYDFLRIPSCKNLLAAVSHSRGLSRHNKFFFIIVLDIQICLYVLFVPFFIFQ